MENKQSKTREQKEKEIFEGVTKGRPFTVIKEQPVVDKATELLLTDEEIKLAWYDCYGSNLPGEYGLLFGRTVRSRQLAKLQRAGYMSPAEINKWLEEQGAYHWVEHGLDAEGNRYCGNEPLRLEVKE